jgi:transcriptional regulator with XRE-family HTH domain
MGSALLEMGMQDRAFRRALGARIKALRKQKRWTQKELAARLGINFLHLNKYESGLAMPPIEKLTKVALALDTSLDFLATGKPAPEAHLRNSVLLERFLALEDFAQEDQDAIVRLIDAMIIKGRVEGALKFERGRAHAKSAA